MPCSSRTTSTSPARPGTSSVAARSAATAGAPATAPATARRRPAAAPAPTASVRRDRADCHAAGRGRHLPSARDRSRGRARRWTGLVAHGARHCAVRIIGSRRGRVPIPSPRSPTRDPIEDHRADLPVRLHRVRPRLRAVPELLRRRADRSAPSATAGCARSSTPSAWSSRAPASTAPTAAPRLLGVAPAASTRGSSSADGSLAASVETELVEHDRAASRPPPAATEPSTD